jgi:hypothetical protein
MPHVTISDDLVNALCAEEPGPAVIKALATLFDRDVYLLAVDANERSISHRFAMYLQAQFERFDVDCEYNRDGVEPKKLGHLGLLPDSEDVEAQTVFPDIIVHIRGTNRNYLGVEMKKSTNHVSRCIEGDQAARRLRARCR